jgi:hypothetical protein
MKKTFGRKLFETPDNNSAGKPDEKKPDDKKPDDIEAQLAAAKAENERMKAAEKKAEKDKKDKEKAEADKKALEDGKAKELLAEREKELKALKEENERLNASIKSRIDKKFEALPQASKDKLSIIKDDIALDKLETMIDMEAGTQPIGDKPKGEPPPAPGAGGKDKRQTVGYQIDPWTKDQLEKLGQSDEMIERTKMLGKDSGGKFGYGKTDIDIVNQRAFIKVMKSKAVQPDDPALQNRRGK